MLWTHKETVESEGKPWAINSIASDASGQHFKVHGIYGRRIREDKRQYISLYSAMFGYSIHWV